MPMPAALPNLRAATTRRRPVLLLALALAIVTVPAPRLAAARGEPHWGATSSQPVDTPPDLLRPGEWIWGGDSRALGPIAVVVSLTEQRAYVYRNGLLIAVTTVSTGKPGHETPTGVFTILQKDRHHHSSKYNDAPMPYQERLTWDGVALHAGGLPGYPESHGCVHLPTEFARRLFDASDLGMTVVVARTGGAPASLVHPSAVSPIQPLTGRPADTPRLADGESWRWQPERAPDGPLSMVLSASDQRLLVFRGGIEIGRARVVLDPSATITGTHAYVVAAPDDPGATSGGPVEAATPPSPGSVRWIAIGVPGHEDEAGRALSHEQVAGARLPPDFVSRIGPELRPGTVLVATAAPVLPHTTGPALQVLNADPPADGPAAGLRR